MIGPQVSASTGTAGAPDGRAALGGSALTDGGDAARQLVRVLALG